MAIKAVDNVRPIQREGKCVGCNKDGAGSSGFCRRCIETSDRFEVPNINEFGEETHLVAAELAAIGNDLLENFDDFYGITLMTPKIDYLWKAKGGKKDNANVLGRIQQPQGELAFYSKTDYILWIAADHCYFFNKFQITAVVFHELMHTFYNEFEGTLSLRGHDFEGFRREVEVFGYWSDDIRKMAQAFETVRQPGLFREAGN